MKSSLDSLKLISEQMGKNASLIQASGGNTSLKHGDSIWVKASGKKLADALNEEIFVKLDLNAVIREAKIEDIAELKIQCSTNTLLRPSIETSLHAIMPHKVVLHSHAIDVIALTLRDDSVRLRRERMDGIEWAWISYQRPGRHLSAAIFNALSEQKYDVLILENHGLVVGANTPEDAMNLQYEVIRRLEQPSRRYNICPNISKLQKMTEHIPGIRLPQSQIIHSLATDKWSFELSQRNPYCPDHVVFCGMRPWIYTKESSLPDPDNTYGILPGIGVVLLNNASEATEQMLQAQAEVFLKLPEHAPINLLTDTQCNDLLCWEAEKYRKSLENSV